MPSIPKTPCPVGGLVPWMRGSHPIMSRKPHPVLGWLYTIDQKEKDRPRCFHYNVSQEEIVKEMDLTARFKIGDAVQLGPLAMRRIIARKWDFERGMFKYSVEGTRPAREWTLLEEEVERRIKGATEESA